MVTKKTDIVRLRETASAIAKQFDLPTPKVKAGRLPGKGLQAIPLWAGAQHGIFTINRWALNGKYRRSILSIEHDLLEGCAWWLYSHRHHVLRTSQTHYECQKEVFTFGYGAEKAAKIMEAKAAAGRVSTIGLAVWLGLPFLVMLAAWIF